MSLPRVILVDDERLVVDALAPHLRRQFDVALATSGVEAQALLEAGPEAAVLVTDQRMPSMSGVELLKVASERWPRTVRILMTGYLDLEAAMLAVNEGHAFRVLTKPCAPAAFVNAVAASVEQHRLLCLERDLLEKTVRGVVDTLSEVLEVASPMTFSASRRLRALVLAIADELKLNDRWTLELSALLGHLGNVSLPAETTRKLFFGEPLTEEEAAQHARANELTLRLLSRVPRFEPVVELLTPGASATLLHANVLRVATTYYEASTRGLSFTDAFALIDADGKNDRAVVDALASVQQLARKASRVAERRALDLKPGMTLAEDVRSTMGALLLSRGSVLSESNIERLLNVARGKGLQEPLKVWTEG